MRHIPDERAGHQQWQDASGILAVIRNVSVSVPYTSMVVHAIHELSSNVRMSAYILLMGAKTIAGTHGADRGFWEGFGGIGRCREYRQQWRCWPASRQGTGGFFTWFMPICAAMTRSMRK